MPSYIKYDQITTTADVKTVSDLTVPAKAIAAELQADTSACRYTMDNAAIPEQGVGMVLAANEQPKYFLLAEVKKIKFVRGAGSNGNLNIHWIAGDPSL